MSWPLASHFSAMLQNPRVAFRDPQLQRCQIDKDQRNQPRPWAGAFAVVYKAVMPDTGRSFALRVFTTESPERRERYDLINEYLKGRRLKSLVDFEYRDKSIRSAGDGKWYPLILMDWVQGETLFKWVRTRSLEGNRRALAAAAERWVALTKELVDARIAHGDFQHANVMVTEAGELKLVDYDCVCVPALVGRRNLEVGVEPYQHTDRNEATHLSLDLDHFSALVIYAGLKGLAADPSLWNKYVEGPGYDKLLFRKEDFQAPAASPLFGDLFNSPDRDVREAAEQLLTFSRVRMDQVPPLSHLTNSYNKVEQLLVSQQWDAAVQLLNRRGQFRDAPPHLKPLIDQAYEHVCRQEAWARFQGIRLALSEPSDRELLGAWNESVFRGFEPAERFRPHVVAARKQIEVLERLRLLVQEASATTSLSREKGIAAAAALLPEGYQYSLRTRVQQAQQRVEAIQGMESVIRQADDEPIVAAWQQACQIRCEGLIPRDQRPRIDLALKRLPILRVLRQLPPDLPYDQLDRRVLDVWQEEIIAGTPEAEAWRPFYQQSLYRRDLLRNLEQAIGRRDEAAIAETIRNPYLKDYPMPPSWAPVIRSARQRIAKLESLLAALEAGDPSKLFPLFDARILRQYEERFRPYQQVLEAWTRAEVLPAERIGLRPAVGRASLVRLEKRRGSYRVRWTWPQPRFTNECVLAVCSEPPGPDDDPRQLPALFRVPLDRQNWESGGGSRVIHVKPEWAGSVVVVWAVVDLGFRLLFSHPLTLGQLESRRGLFGGPTGPQGSQIETTVSQVVPPLPPGEGRGEGEVPQ
jgi:hypothetical protein